MKLSFQLSEEQEKRLRIIARREGVEPAEWLKNKAVQIRKQLLGERDEIDFKEAARELNVSVQTISRYYQQGLFPNAMRVNARVIRIPRSDLAKLKDSRRITRQK